MALKLKMDGDKVVLDKGMPIVIDDEDNNAERPFDINQTVGTIRRLNGEAKAHREAKEAAEAALVNFKDLDPVKAREALEKVANLSTGELKTAAQVEEIKREAQKAAEKQVQDLQRSSAELLKKAEGERDSFKGALEGEKITNAFSTSPYIQGKIAVPPPLIQSHFGKNIKFEEGKLVAYDESGNKIYSKANPGELATFEEAVAILVDTSPYRNNLLKGTGSGSGAGAGAGGGASGDKQMTRSDFEKLDPGMRSTRMGEGYTVVDG
jgi:hypothetical protein